MGGSQLPHMLPSSEAFSAATSALGLSNDSHIVVYDGKGIFSAARAWWYSPNSPPQIAISNP